MPFERDPNELGVLWEKSGGKGQYFTGSLEIDGVKTKIVVFKNGNKRNEKAPDWRILKAQPREHGNPTQGDASVNEVGYVEDRRDYDPPF